LGGVDGAVVRTRDRDKIWALGRLDVFPDSGIKPVVGGCVEGDVGKGLYPEVFLTKYVGVEVPFELGVNASDSVHSRVAEYSTGRTTGVKTAHKATTTENDSKEKHPIAFCK